ncbi:hypothetical protein COLO4_15664 [Corchorus olitorius]|uniref:Endonuclease/exonuclease/phosphatase n=1 Tax=Corchorus olitorius TaxID=93759 RepID=A0A1R3JLT0_9ROSI|nr:hypothetical protein COLO4_15664 [Corchorus olitorius]
MMFFSDELCENDFEYYLHVHGSFETLESVLDIILNPSINLSIKKPGIPPTLAWDNLVAIEKTLDIGSYINCLVPSEAFFVVGTLARETGVEKLVEDEFKEAKACAIREAEVPSSSHWVVDTLKRVIFPRKLPFVKLFAVPSDVRETSIMARSYTEIDSLQRVVGVVIMPLCHRNANIIWEGVNGAETDPQLVRSWWGPGRNVLFGLRILVWNCLGVSEPGFHATCRDIVHQYNPNVLLLVEIGAWGSRARQHASAIGFSRSYVVDSGPMCKGMWLLWNDDDVSVEVLSYSDRSIDVDIQVPFGPLERDEF